MSNACSDGVRNVRDFLIVALQAPAALVGFALRLTVEEAPAAATLWSFFDLESAHAFGEIDRLEKDTAFIEKDTALN